MDGVSGVGGVPAGGMPIQPKALTGAEQTAAVPIEKGLGTSASTSESITSKSATSISATSESLIASNGPVLADDQILGIVVLLLTLQYLQSEDEEEKEGLLALMIILAQQQQANANSETLMYNSSSLNVATTQSQTVSSDAAISAYTGSAGNTQQPPAVNPGAGSGGLDVVA